MKIQTKFMNLSIKIKFVNDYVIQYSKILYMFLNFYSIKLQNYPICIIKVTVLIWLRHISIDVSCVLPYSIKIREVIIMSQHDKSYFFIIILLLILLFIVLI